MLRKRKRILTLKVWRRICQQMLPRSKSGEWSCLFRNIPERKDWEFDGLLSNLVESGCNVVPVDHIPPSINILGAVIHVVEIVGVLPDIDD